MKLFLTTAIFLLAGIYAYSQDAIVTQNGKVIDCKITKSEEQFIYFTMQNDSATKPYKMDKKYIKQIMINGQTFDVNLSGNNISIGTARPLARKPMSKYPAVRVNASIGYGYQIGQDASNNSYAKNLSDQLRKGLYVDVEAAYYFRHRRIGIGGNISNFNASGSLNNITLTYTPINGSSSIIRSGNLTDNISIFMVGPFFTFRTISTDEAIDFTIDAGPSIAIYSETVRVNSEQLIDVEGLGEALRGSAQLKFRVSKHTHLGVHVAGMLGAVSAYTVNGESVSASTTTNNNNGTTTTASAISLIRVEAGVGVQIRF